MGKYLDNTGLQVLWNKIKSVFLPKSGGTITGNLTVQGTSGIDCEYNVQASGFVHTNPTNTNDMLLANGNTLPQSTFSLSGHTLSNDDGKAIAKAIAEAVARAQEAYSYTDNLRNQFDEMMGTMFLKIKELENEIITMKQVIEKLKNN